MLKIRTEQIQALQNSLDQQHRQDSISKILARLKKTTPGVLKPYGPGEQRQRVDEVLDACERLKIQDPEYRWKWSYISFRTNTRFYDSGQFSDILEHPFLHPDAKGRHIVLAYAAIERMTRERR